MATRRRPLTITLSAREAVASGAPFRPRGEPLSDPGVALDEISSLRAAQEPLVLRATAEGGSERARRMAQGEWFCDSDGSPPRWLPRPNWSWDVWALRWSSSRGWLGAWEGCENATWLLRAAWSVVADTRSVAAAARACARVALPELPPWEARPLEAIEAADAYDRGEGDINSLRYVVSGASFAAQYFNNAGRWRQYHAANAAYYSCSYPVSAAAGHAARAISGEAGGTAYEAAMSRLAKVVRACVATDDVLRGASRPQRRPL